MRRLFGSIAIPSAVLSELTSASAPSSVSAWAQALPDWINVQTCSNLLALDLGRGETEAISLALEISATEIIMDEKRGRAVAKQNGLEVIGLLTIIRRSHQLGFLNAVEAFEKLKSTNFHVSTQLVKEILDSLQ